LDHALKQWAESISTSKTAISHRQLELYFQNIILASINKAIFYQKLSMTAASERVLESVNNLFEQLKKSNNRNTKSICARYLLTKAVLCLDQSITSIQAIDDLLEAIKLLMEEQKGRTYNIFFLGQQQIKEEHMLRRNVYKIYFYLNFLDDVHNYGCF
jgi:hypothetical protein